MSRDYIEDLIEDLFIWFIVIGGLILILIIPTMIFFGNLAALICLSIWIAIWGLSFVLFLSWPFVRWITLKVSRLIKEL